MVKFLHDSNALGPGDLVVRAVIRRTGEECKCYVPLSMYVVDEKVGSEYYEIWRRVVNEKKFEGGSVVYKEEELPSFLAQTARKHYAAWLSTRKNLWLHILGDEQPATNAVHGRIPGL